MLLVSDYNDVQGPARLLVISISIGLAIGAFIIAAIMFANERRSSISTQKNYFIGLGIFAFCMGVGRFVFLYHDYFAADELDLVLWKVGNAMILVGLTSLAFSIERFIFQKTKKAITVIGIITTVFFILLEKSLATIIVYIGNAVLMLLPFFIYVYIARISTGRVRYYALIIIMGFILSFVGQLGGAILFNIGLLDRVFSQIFGVGIGFIGLTMIAYGMFKGTRPE